MRIGQTADPNVPPSILDPASEPNKDIHDHQHWKGRIGRYDGKGKHVTCWADERHPSTTETLVDQITENGGDGVAQKW